MTAEKLRQYGVTALMNRCRERFSGRFHPADRPAAAALADSIQAVLT